MSEIKGFSSGRVYRGVTIHSMAGDPEKCYVIDDAGVIHGFYNRAAAEGAVDVSLGLAGRAGGERDLFPMTTSVACKP